MGFDLAAYAKAKQTVRTTTSQTTITTADGVNRRVLVDHSVATIPGAFTEGALECWTVSVRAAPIAGLSSNVTEVIGSSIKSAGDALAKAKAKLDAK